MGWKQERDLLIAQTLAFVHSVTGQGNTAAPGRVERPATQPDAEAIEIEAVEIRAAEIIHAPAAPPREIDLEVPRELAIPLPRAMVSSDIRSEMQARVASFRAHQQRFDREREQYCSATLTRVRTALGHHPASDLLSRQRPPADPAR